MPYRPNPPEPPDFDSVAENVADWVLAPSGKWFIGVIDTDRNQMFVVPVNVFEGRGALDQNTLNNASQRGNEQVRVRGSSRPNQRSTDLSYIQSGELA
jgi:hypothetical protein